MPRTARIAPGGMVFHVLNRANNRDRIFATPEDYLAFLRVLRDSLDKKPMRILSYCLMPNHWHLLLWPRKDGELGEFLQIVTTTHVRRWRLFRQSVGGGHLYQGTYKSFPVQDDDHYYSVSRYIERNALRAGLIERAEDWHWGSLWQRLQRIAPDDYPPLHPWPLPIPRNWTTLVNRPETAAELDALRTSVRRGRPFGSEVWQQRAAKRLGLESTFRSRGRPKKAATT
jgi:REP-associated tyrosine transposase